MAINPEARSYSMTPAEEKEAKKAGKTPEQIAEEKKQFEQATARATEPGVIEISKEEQTEAAKPGAIDRLIEKAKEAVEKAFEKKS